MSSSRMLSMLLGALSEKSLSGRAGLWDPCKGNAQTGEFAADHEAEPLTQVKKWSTDGDG